MDSSKSSSKRLKLELKADDAHGPVNSLRLVRGANFPFAIELSVLSFLSLGECAGLTTLSKAMTELVKTHFSQLFDADVWQEDDGPLERPGFVLQQLRHCNRLRSLAVSGKFLLAQWSRAVPLLAAVILANNSTLERVEVDERKGWSLPLLAAMEACPQLAEFRDDGLDDSAGIEQYRKAVLRVFKSCTQLSHFLSLGPVDDRGRLWLDAITLRQLYESRAFLLHDVCFRQLYESRFSSLRSLTLEKCGGPAFIHPLELLTGLTSLRLHVKQQLGRGVLAALAGPLRGMTRLRKLNLRADDSTPSPPWQLSSSLTALDVGPPQGLSEHDQTCIEIRASGLRSARVVYSDQTLCVLLESNASLTSLSSASGVLPKMGPSTCSALLKRSSLTRLNLYCQLPVEAMLGMGQSLPALTELSGMLIWTAASDFAALLASLPSLCKFQMPCHRGSQATPVLPVLAASVELPKLQWLGIGEFDESLLRLSLPNLDTFASFSAQGPADVFVRFVRSLPKLASLSITAAWFDETMLRAVLTPLASLRTLILQQCPLLTPAALTVIGDSSLPRLKELHVEECFAVNSEIAAQQVERLCALHRALPQLRVVDVGFSEAVQAQARERVAAEKAAATPASQ